jgi:hypothetical protein
MESFPLGSLTPKQTVIVGELLRVHPLGRVAEQNGQPVFVSDDGAAPLVIPLTPGRTEPEERPTKSDTSRPCLSH